MKEEVSVHHRMRTICLRVSWKIKTVSTLQSCLWTLRTSLFPYEQKHIIEYINHETDKIDKSIATIEKEIELITEFRTSLISNVVTGKLDVRDILLEENGEVNAYYEILEDETMELEEVLEGEECEV